VSRGPGRAAVAAAVLEGAWASRRRAGAPRRAPDTPDVRWVPLGRATVRARLSGAGPAPPIVLIPDPPNTIEHYGDLVTRLAPGGPVLCFDPPGFGFSAPAPGFRYTLDEHAALMAELLDALGLHHVTLSVGCLGGFAGMRLARRRPDLVARLVLVQVPSCDAALRWVRGGYWWLLGTPFLGQLVMAGAKARVTRAWYRACLGPGARRDSFLQPGLDALRRGGAFSLASAFQMFRPDLLDFSGIRQEALVVWGGADATHPDTDPRSALVHLPRATWIEWPACGHYPDLEDAKAYALCLRG
jgi:pimeloyl-ACP methyl ester carboxylesterase